MFLRVLRNVPYHVVMIALENTVIEESTGVRYVGPSFQGSTRNEIGQWFNVVGYMLRRAARDDEGRETVNRSIMLEGPNRYVCKPQHPLTGYVEPNIASIVDALSGDPETDTNK